MKSLLLIFTLLFSTLMFSSPSYAKWEKVGENVHGDTFYVDYERIRKHGGYVYWWELTDLLKPIKHGHLSGKIYVQGDCKSFRSKNLSFLQHKQSMGRGSRDNDFDYNPKNPEWEYPIPESVSEGILKSVCSR